MSMRSSTLERPNSSPGANTALGVITPPPFRGLDGLRAIAVIAVVLFHLTPGAWPGGFIGVDLFFVISGFLITALLLREHEMSGRIALGRFWKRRARRLVPALGIVVVVTGGAAWAIGGDVLVDLGRQVLGAVTFSSNWLSIASGSTYFDDTAPELFRNLWSLGIEEQFYLAWPVVMLGICALPKMRWRLLLIGVGASTSAIAMAMLSFTENSTRVYYGTDTHSFPLAIGALLAVATAAWPFREIGWSRLSRFFTPLLALPGIVGLVIAFALVNGDDAATYRGALVAVSASTALVIAGAIVPGSWIGRMLDAAPLRYIGLRSYGLYLWHWPVLVLVQSALPSWPREGASAWAMGGMALVITVVAAVLSYRYVETPVRRRGFRQSARVWAIRAKSGWRPATVTAVVLALATASVAGTAAAIATPTPESSAHESIQRGIEALERQDSGAGAPSTSSPTSPSTNSGGAPGSASGIAPVAEPVKAPPGIPATGPEITAIGDSVMLASAPALQEAFPGIQIDAVVSRQLRDAPAILQSMADAGTLRRVVVIGLGTNGPIDDSALADARRIAGPDRNIVVVSVQAPRGWTDGVNQQLGFFAQRYRDVEISTWRETIAGQLDLLSGDQIHPGPRGGGVYASSLRDALQRLADLPPVPERRPKDFE